MSFAPAQLPSGRWQGGFRHPVTRKKITRTFDYSYEAEAWALTEEQRAKRGPDSPTSTELPVRPPVEVSAPKWTGPSVGEYGKQFLRRRAGLVERATREKYDSWLSGLGAHLVDQRPPLAQVPMGMLSKADVQQWLTDSREAKVGRPTINGRLRLLRMLYTDLLDSDDAPEGVRDPTRGMKFLPEEHDTDYTLSPTEEDELLAAMTGLGLDQLRVASLVALEAGLRWQEVYALRAEAVTGHYLLVSHVIERGTRELRGFPKGKRTRVVPMTERLEDEIAPWVASARKTSCRLLFPAYSRSNRQAPQLQVWDYSNHRKRQWLPALFEVGAAQETFSATGRTRRDGSEILQRRLVDPAYGFHALRHTYGSRMAAAGVVRSEIAQLMGHADERVTGRYIHQGDDGRRLELVRSVERARVA